MKIKELVELRKRVKNLSKHPDLLMEQKRKNGIRDAEDGNLPTELSGSYYKAYKSRLQEIEDDLYENWVHRNHLCFIG